MENYRLKSKVSVDEREFLVQTVNDVEKNTVISSLFVDGNILEISQYSHPETVSDDEVMLMVKSTHDEKKTELEHLLETYYKIIGSGDSELMFNIGTAFYYKKLYTEAEALFEAVISCAPDHHRAGNNLGLALYALGRYDDAAKVLGRAVELRPNFADYHNNYGEALLESGFCRRAVEEFEAALKLNIYYADAYFNLGIAYIVNAITREDYSMYPNLLEKTADMLNRATLISSEYRTDRFEEARQLLGQGELARAVELFKAIRDAKRDCNRQEFSSFYLRFLLYSDRANEQAVKERKRHLSGEISRNPNYADLHHELALCHLQEAQLSWQRSIQSFEKAMQINPKLAKSQAAMERARQFSDTIRDQVLAIVKGEGE